MQRYVQFILSLILLCICPQFVWSQEGKQFWFAAPEMALHSQDMSLELYLFADDQPAEVVISMPADTSFALMTVHLDAKTSRHITLNPTYQEYMQQMASYHNKVNNRGLLLSADQPISAYIQMTGVNSETYSLKGERALGTDFMAAIQNHYRNSNSISQHNTYTNAYSSAQIIATEDSTWVTIEPTQVLYGDTTIVPRTVMLNRGQVYSFRAVSKRAEAHITATRIRSSQPIVVMTMDDSMSPYRKYYGEDAVAEQMVPSSLLGTDYIAMGNGLKWEGVVITDLQTGKSEFRPMNGQTTMVIHSETPVQVFQITGYSNEAGGAQLPTLDNAGSLVTHYARLANSHWTWFNVLTPTTNTAHLTMNEEPIDSTIFQPVPDAPEWSVAKIDVSSFEIGQFIELRSSKERFHMAVVDATSIVQSSAADRHYVATSCSYGYFSDYVLQQPVEIPPVVVVDTVPPVIMDTIPEIPDTIVVVDTIVVPPDTTPVQKKERHGHFALYLEGAYSHIPFGNSDFRWGLGYGAGIGFLYEYQKNHFLLDVGVGFLWQDVEHRRNQDMSMPWIDSQGSESTLYLRAHRNDRSRMGYVEVPILVGGTWNWFYLLGGVKVGVPVFGNTRCQVRATDVAMYDQYWVPFIEMPNHGIRTNVPVEHKGDKLDAQVDTRLSLEIGANLGSDERARYRLGLYADYGLLFPNKNHDAPWMDSHDAVHMERWEMNHPLLSSEANSHWAQNLFMGIKMTIIF